jgi:S1-C subfamily serine protease
MSPFGFERGLPMKMNSVLGLGILLFATGCERIPEWERTAQEAEDGVLGRRYAELSKWLWSCRGEVASNRKPSELELLQDHFRERNLSTLDSQEVKVFLTSGFVWDAAGRLIVSWPRQWEVKNFECRGQGSEWKSAKLLGHDSALDVAVVSVGSIANLAMTNPWLERSSRLKFDEKLLLATSPFAGRIETWPVSIQSLHPQLGTSMDEDLFLFDSPLTSVQKGSVLLDRDWKVVGLALSTPGSIWGVGLTVSKVRELAEALITEGDVKRPYLGFKLKFYPDEGFRVAQVEVGGPAYEAGLRADDQLVQWDGLSLEKQDNWIEPRRSDVGRKIAFRYKRSTREIESVLKVSSR